MCGVKTRAAEVNNKRKIVETRRKQRRERRRTKRSVKMIQRRWRRTESKGGCRRR